jgi:hypothetical protein|tara:strand:+ start:458 stop:697 length:240 start_codon:yes stop_codon:yes gene_type:complete
MGDLSGGANVLILMVTFGIVVGMGDVADKRGFPYPLGAGNVCAFTFLVLVFGIKDIPLILLVLFMINICWWVLSKLSDG